MKEIMKGLVCGGMVMGLLLAGACTEEDLDKRKPAGFVEIALKWDEHFASQPAGTENADCGRIFFYPESADMEPFCKECPDGVFKGSLPAGRYRILTMNSQFRDAVLSGEESFDKAMISVVPNTEAGQTAEWAGFSRADALPIISEQPGSVFLSHGFDAAYKDAQFPNGLDETDSDVLIVPDNRDTVKTQTSLVRLMVKRVKLTIILKDLDFATCEAILSGIAGTIHCAECRCTPASARVKFTPVRTEKVGNSETFGAEFSVFDLIEPGERTHLLELHFTKEDGSKFSTTVDLSDRVKEDLDGSGDFSYDIPLDLNIEVTQGIDGSLHATVQPWNGGGSGSGVGGYIK